MVEQMEDTIVMKEDGVKISRRIEEGLRRWEEEGVRKCEEEIHRRRGNGTVPRKEDEACQQLRDNGKRRETPRKSSDSSKITQRSEEERLLRQIEDVSRRRKDGIVQREEVIIVEGGHRRKMSSGQEVPVPAPRKRDDRSHSESHSYSHSHSKKAKSHSHAHSHSKSQSQSSTTSRRDGISSSAVSPRKEAKRSISPRRDGKRSISPKKESAHQSVSPRKDAKRSISPCREGKRSISPRREAKRSISPKKEARQSTSPTTANRKDERPATSSRGGFVMCHHNDQPISPRGSAACYRDERAISPRVSAIRPHSPGEEALGPMSPRHMQEPAFSCTNELFSSTTPRREPQPRTASLGTSMGSSIETSTTGAHFTDTQPRTTSMGTSMGSSMETSTGEQETTPQFFKGAPAMALRGETVPPRDSTTWGLQSDEILQPFHRAQVESHTHMEFRQDVVSQPQRDAADPRELRAEVLQPISPALRSRDFVSHSQRDPRDLRPELVRPISPALRSPALSCPVPRPPTTITSSSLTSTETTMSGAAANGAIPKHSRKKSLPDSSFLHRSDSSQPPYQPLDPPSDPRCHQQAQVLEIHQLPPPIKDPECRLVRQERVFHSLERTHCPSSPSRSSGLQGTASLGRLTHMSSDSIDWGETAEEGGENLSDCSLLHCVTPAPIEFGDAQPLEETKSVCELARRSTVCGTRLTRDDSGHDRRRVASRKSFNERDLERVGGGGDLRERHSHSRSTETILMNANERDPHPILPNKKPGTPDIWLPRTIRA